MLHLSYLKPVQTRISFMFSASHASSCLVGRRNRRYRWYRVSLLVTLLSTNCNWPDFSEVDINLHSTP